MSNFGLPSGYVERFAHAYCSALSFSESDVNCSLDVYEAAEYFLQADGRTTIIDIACGNGRKLRSVLAEHHIGIDSGENISLCRKHYGTWGQWIEIDIASEQCISVSNLANDRTVVVCANVLESLLNPEPLTALLAACYHRGAIVLTGTPDRIRMRGLDHR